MTQDTKQTDAGTFYQVVPKPEKAETEIDGLDTDTVDGGPVNYSDFGKVYMFGDKTSGFKRKGPPQDFEKLREELVRNKSLFNDETFSPKFIQLTKLKGDVQWKRPVEISQNPRLIVDGATRFDIDQGQLGDCWFLAAVANLTTNQKLFSMVVPGDQDFTENYAGIFHFRFWQYGRWVDVVIDDRLPTVNNKLVYLMSEDRNEFWPALLEKAYAKFYGSYKNIEGGQITEALEDLCGGLSEYYKASHPQIFDIMSMSYERSSFMGCSILSAEREGRRADGLITSHAYSITCIKTLSVNDSEKGLIRIRNPWGNEAEWNGDWSDKSECWDLVPPETKQKLLVERADGEFWMAVEDFQKCFTYVDICHLNPSSFSFTEDSKNWNVSMFEGSWVPNVTAGGGYVNKDTTFASNPQYFFSVRGDNSSDTYAMVIGLLQKDRRRQGEDELRLELDIFSVQTGQRQLLDKAFFESQKPVLHRLDEGLRQLTVRVMLPPGRYCLVPCTYDPNEYASYLLRMYSEVSANVTENDDEVGYSNDAILNQPIKENQPEDYAIAKLFKKVAGSHSEIGWYSVQKALKKAHETRKLFCFTKPEVSFSKDTCKNIVALWDVNYSGRLDQEEFAHLMRDVAALKAIFKKFDVDNSGKLNGFELRNLLAACGYKVNRQILVIIMLRYGYKGSMNFQNFVVCAFKLKTMIDEFHRRQTIEVRDQINVTRRDWLQTTLYS